MSKFEVGDTVKCIDNDGWEDDIFINKTYTVLENLDEGRSIMIEDERGSKYGYYARRFELVANTNIDQLVKLAKTFLNKKCVGLDGNSKYTPTSVLVYVDAVAVQASSFKAITAFEKYGSVVILQGEGYEIPVQLIKLYVEVPTTITLTDDYDAEVFKDKVVVGCQCIPKEKILQIYNLMQED